MPAECVLLCTQFRSVSCHVGCDVIACRVKLRTKTIPNYPTNWKKKQKTAGEKQTTATPQNEEALIFSKCNVSCFICNF